MPNWLQCSSKQIKKIKWESDIRDYDIFLGILQGDDGEANHAITIFNKWIFDANEKYAIPLCEVGLNYCVSTSETRVKFLGFTEGFFL